MNENKVTPTISSLGRLGVTAAGVLGVLALSACSTAPKTAATPLLQPKIYGFVFVVPGADSSERTPVGKARVWTEPPTNVAETDSLGYWEINEGLTPGQYRVMAEREGIAGNSVRFSAELGTSTKVMVRLQVGGGETTWPPPLSTLDTSKPGTRGPGCLRGQPSCVKGGGR